MNDQSLQPGAKVHEASGTPFALPHLLMLWTSPAFPAGSFAFSHGLEWLAEDGRLTTRTDLEHLLVDLVERGSVRNDLILICETWRRAMANDRPGFAQVAELALALQPSRERHLESVTQGRSFVEAILAAWPAPRMALHDQSSDIAYSTALALAGAAHDLPLESICAAHGLGFVSNLASAAIRLSVVGQTDAQRVLASLLPVVVNTAHQALSLTIDDLGSALYAVDLAALRHETQYSRLFRS